MILLKINLSELIIKMAARKAYGIKEKDINIFEDTSENALWSWETNELQYLPLNLQKTIPAKRGK